jgi:hypothetical protein
VRAAYVEQEGWTPEKTKKKKVSVEAGNLWVLDELELCVKLFSPTLKLKLRRGF